MRLINCFKYISVLLVLAVCFVLLGGSTVFAADFLPGDVITTGTSVETTQSDAQTTTQTPPEESSEETTGTVTETTTAETTKAETTTETTTAITIETTTETTTVHTSTETTQTTTKTTTQTTTQAATQTTTKEQATETTTKAPSEGGGTSHSSGGGGGGSSKTCRVTFAGGENGSIGGKSSVTVVLYKGSAPKASPKAVPKAGYVFVGWSKNGTTITDPTKVPLYSNTVYTAVYRQKKGIDRLIDIGGILDMLGI